MKNFERYEIKILGSGLKHFNLTPSASWSGKIGHCYWEEEGGETKMLGNGREVDGNWGKRVGNWGEKGGNWEKMGWELGEKTMGLG